MNSTRGSDGGRGDEMGSGQISKETLGCAKAAQERGRHLAHAHGGDSGGPGRVAFVTGALDGREGTPSGASRNQVLRASQAAPRAPPSPLPSPAPARAPLRIHRLPLAEGSGSRLACSNRAQWELGDWPSKPEAGLEAVATGRSARVAPARNRSVRLRGPEPP